MTKYHHDVQDKKGGGVGTSVPSVYIEHVYILFFPLQIEILHSYVQLSNNRLIRSNFVSIARYVNVTLIWRVHKHQYKSLQYNIEVTIISTVIHLLLLPYVIPP